MQGMKEGLLGHIIITHRPSPRLTFEREERWASKSPWQCVPNSAKGKQVRKRVDLQAH